MPNPSFEQNHGIGFITFDTPDSKVNILTAQTLSELDSLLKRIQSESPLKALVLRSAKKGIFIAGADIKEIDAISDGRDAEEKSRAGQAVLNALEDLPIPSVALLNGTTLGGGLELALAATYRFAALGEEFRIGLPEVKLGVIPGFGGTWRLPLRTGLTRGLEWITQGKAVSPAEAHRAGIVDSVAHEERLEETALDFLEKTNYRKRTPNPPWRPLTQRLLEDTFFGRALIAQAAKRAILDKTRGQYPASLRAARVVVDNWRAPRESALKREAREFGSLVADGTHKPLIHVFYLTERYKKEKWTAALGILTPAKIGVVGAGVMGGGIAQIASKAGVEVRLKDMNPEALLVGLRSAHAAYGDEKRRRHLSACEAKSGMARILPALDYTGFRRCGLVIEAVVENLGIKKKVFAELELVASPEAVLVSNTSSLSIARMAESVKNPARVAGMHFFNPVQKMPLVEVIRAERTSENTVATLVEWARRLRKTPVVVKDSPGFLVNRLLMPYLNEAGALFEEGAAPDAIDKTLMDFGMPMGAFRLLDEIGMDVAAKVSHVLYEAFGERMTPCPAVDEMVEKKWLGRKSGRGFYLYEKGKCVFNPQLAVLPIKRRTNHEEIIDRCVLLMVNEAARCLEERVVREAADVDISMILGAGWPAFRGGLLCYADTGGIGGVIDRLKKWRDRTRSARFEPAPLLVDLARRGSRFYAS